MAANYQQLSFWEKDWVLLSLFNGSIEVGITNSDSKQRKERWARYENRKEVVILSLFNGLIEWGIFPFTKNKEPVKTTVKDGIVA
ncbi:hypothetical protein Cantr_05501 [Candida viswanathii]|uniref:Uncharacterized protein n=1 Tax=Candida viswanathii TaxID=5486 RepID=A0A367XQG1_9ASCO|nr:hypothetical protein Cantr_05501 [Candida viswanathii]